MKENGKKQHLIGLIMLSTVAIFWGAGFVLNAQLLDKTFYDTPSLLNALRFAIATACLAAVFNKKLRFNKHILLYGSVGGALLFVGFMLQLVGMKYTSPSHSGFFTAFYVVLTPFIVWMVYRRHPHWSVFVGAALAISGLLILNISGGDGGASWKGDVIILLSAAAFAAQIVWADYLLKKDKTDYVQLTFWQIAFAAALFVLYTLIFESKHYSSMHFDAGYDIWRLAIVVLGGTAFAYYAQTYAQIHLTPSETSLIMACESPIGAFISMTIGLEPFLWQTIAGGCMVIAAVILVELVPNLRRKRTAQTAVQPPPDDETTDDNG